MKLTQKNVTLLWAAFAILASTLLAANGALLVFSDAPATPTGAATANVDACVNFKPYWLNQPDCEDAYSDNPYTCNVSADDADHNVSTYTGFWLSGNSNGTGLFNNISSDGIMYFNASYNQSGNYSVQINAQDDSTCPLTNSTTINITIIASNQSPIFDGPLPDSTWKQDTILVPYDLDDYFTDPEGFTLAYSASGNSEIKVSISNGEVTYQPAQGFCGEEIVTFTATDVTNLTAQSNQVTLTVECDDSGSEDTSSTSSGGGGGGGGSSSTGTASTCTEDFYCYDWSTCQYTKAISSVDERTINITGVRGTKQYTLDEPLAEGEEVFYEGYQYRECIDTRFCTERTLTYARSCSYEPHCDDGIQNQDETGIDCGGVCGPCSTCEDGIHNGAEEDVDCGGPECPACNTCTDGVINGQELGVDCGGPDCPACATCFDGIQNQQETGVDCGGPNCAACAQEQEPGVVGTALTTILLVALGLLAALVAAIVFARQYVIRWLAAYALRYKKTNRVILLSQEDKQAVLAELGDLREELASLDAVVAQQRLAKAVRSYFIRALDLEFEFDADDLAQAVDNVQESLAALLQAYFSRVQSVEFARDPVHSPLVDALISELEQLVYQTSVLSVEELRRFEEPITLQDASQKQGLEAFYALLANAQLAVESGRAVLARNAYAQAHELYESLDDQQRGVAHPELHRVYLALQLEDYKQQSLLFLRSTK